MATGTSDALARALLSARDENRQIAPLSDSDPSFDMADGRAIGVAVRALRTGRGERVVGRKIGFTNRTLWDRYGVDGPIWGDVFDTTLHRLGPMPARVPLPRLPEPRVEPEIIFGFRAAPTAGMDDATLLDTIGWVSHGFEIVSSVFPGWRFAAPDCQAAFGLHGALYVGAEIPLSDLGPDPAAALSGLTITLTDGSREDTGRGANVLDGPVQALRYLLRGLEDSGETPVAAGDVVTTGTLTDALPTRPGDRWRTILDGVSLPGLDVTFTG